MIAVTSVKRGRGGVEIKPYSDFCTSLQTIEIFLIFQAWWERRQGGGADLDVEVKLETQRRRNRSKHQLEASS